MSVTRPYVLLSCAVSADGYLDDATPERLILSGPADLDRVDEVRASCDAILVGAGTVRKDRPRLRIRDPRRVAVREARGLPPHPLRVTLTASGNLDLDGSWVVYQGPRLSLPVILQDLAERSVARLLVEGGARILGDFLAKDLADELHLAVAPFFVGDAGGGAGAPRLSVPVPRPERMTLAEVRRVGDMAVSRYLLGPGGPDQRFLRWAVELSRLCPPSSRAFSVGAVIVSEDGDVLATGYSREQEEQDHAEEVALRKAGGDPRLRHATLYSSLVPCGARASRPVTCVQHVVAAGIPRVVYAWPEPPVFTAGEGAEQLQAAGVSLTEISSLAEVARSVNASVLGTAGW